MRAKSFVNHYEILEVSPSAGPEAIGRKFRHLARRYHPDNQITGDRSKFDAIVEAHEILKDAIKRTKYHETHQHDLPPFQPSVEEEDYHQQKGGGAESSDGDAFVDRFGIDRDISIQNNILMMLYIRRRTNTRAPGIGNAELERLSGCPSEHLDFNLWYLKAKGWVCTGESGLIEITIDGVDRASNIYRENEKKLITSQA